MINIDIDIDIDDVFLWYDMIGITYLQSIIIGDIFSSRFII